MREILVLGPASHAVHVVGFLHCSRVKQKGDYLVLLLPRQHRQPIFDFLDAHD